MLAVNQLRAYMLAVGVTAFYTTKTVSASLLSPIFVFLAKNYTIQHMGVSIVPLRQSDTNPQSRSLLLFEKKGLKIDA
jgi:hypothetical protein